MRRRLTICCAALVTIVAGAASLASPASAAGTADQGFLGCTIEQYRQAITGAHESCRSLGYDGGTVTECVDGGGYSFECWYL